MSNRETVWEFKTANFRVALEIEPEDMDPADSFQFEDDIEVVRSGEVEWFQALVCVYGPDGQKLAWDSLGGCAYHTVREFYTAHRTSDASGRNCSKQTPDGKRYNVCHYFPGMVRQACEEAREAFAARRAKFDLIELRA